MSTPPFEERLARLHEPHVQPLTQFREQLLKTLPAGTLVPHFDPVDAGVKARVLLLLETPGRAPRTTRFTSLDNPSVTSRNLRALVADSGLRRADVLVWNFVPWDIGLATQVQPTTRRHHALGAPALLQLLALLPALRAVVFFGAKAQKALPVVRAARPELALIACPHPSGQVLNTRPEMRGRILDALRLANAAQAANAAREAGSG